MTLSANEVEETVKEIIALSLQMKEYGDRIKLLKAEVKEYTEIEDICNHVWQVDDGYLEVKTEIKYKLAEIPADVTIDNNACPIDLAEKAFSSKIILSKEGKQMLKEEYPSIMKLMIPTEKKTLTVVV